MKIFTTILLLSIGSFLLSACQATARDDDGYVSVGTNGGYYDYDDDRRGKFCPPGQAKKGNC